MNLNFFLPILLVGFSNGNEDTLVIESYVEVPENFTGKFR